MSLLDDMVAKLAADCPSLVASDAAWSMAPVDDVETESPRTFVYPAADNAGTNRQDRQVAQSVTTDWVVFILCKLSDLETVRGEVRASLLGWEPTALHDTTVFVSGEAQDIKGTYIWWRDTYRTMTHIRNT